MLKGSQKKIIVVKTADSSVFEEAHFILRNDYEPAQIDMVAEANRLIGNCEDKYKKRKKRGKISPICGVAFFLGGSTVGCSLLCAVYLIAKFVA